MLNESRAKRAIVRCCSLQDTLNVPPEHRKYRRVHGLQLPLHPQQVIGWVLLIIVFVGTFTVLLTTPPLLPDLRFVLSLLFAALFVLHVLAHLTVLLLDPADPEVRARLVDEVVPEFDRTKHRHVIENGRCHLCNITTRGRRTKHCSICNKCVPRFDHHCKWLNNCIGGRNYPAFLACLVSTLVIALAVSALSVGELVVVNTDLFGGDRRWIDDNYNDTDNMNNATTPSPSLLITGTSSLVLITIIGVLSAVAAVLLIHLCFFHGYIACLGLTTYEYVRSKREKNIADSRTTSSGLCGTSMCSGNREDVNQISVTEDLCSRFCINRPLLRDNGSTRRTATTMTDVYVRSTHQETQNDDTTETANDACSKTQLSKSSRNFHLCFSYDSNTTETSIEVSSSRTTAELKNHGESIDAKSSSTPSPVSCCFSIMNYPESRHHDRSGHKCRSGENLPKTSKRSCGTMRRIQTFLQTRLRKGSRQRSAISSPAVARHCGNKIIPQTSDSTEIVTPSTAETRVVETTTSTMELATSLPDHIRPPVKLPALDLPRTVHHKNRRTSANPGDISVLVPMPPSVTSKRNQAHLCTRRSLSFSRKRPRFKVGSHVVTQTAQLSPIPESEFSKPATPRSPTRSDSVFAFPPLHE